LEPRLLRKSVPLRRRGHLLRLGGLLLRAPRLPTADRDRPRPRVQGDPSDLDGPSGEATSGPRDDRLQPVVNWYLRTRSRWRLTIAQRSVPDAYSEPGSTRTLRLSFAAFFVSWMWPCRPSSGCVSRIADRKVVLPTGIKTCWPPWITGRGGSVVASSLGAMSSPVSNGGACIR